MKGVFAVTVMGPGLIEVVCPRGGATDWTTKAPAFTVSLKGSPVSAPNDPTTVQPENVVVPPEPESPVYWMI